MVLLILQLAALAALAAFALAALSAPDGGPGGRRILAVALVALAGCSVVVWAKFAGGWRSGFAPALWLTVAATLALFVLGGLGKAAVGRLGPLLAPYLFALGVLAAIWSYAEGAAFVPSDSAWLGLHIVVSVATYALFTLAAVAGAAVFLQERALKARRPNRLTALLPAIADAERLQRGLMLWAAIVLGLGLLSGMAIEYAETARLLDLNHKTVFALAAFIVIGALIAVDRASGLAGKRAARILLLAYLFLTLAYPGVKFVTDVMIGRGAF